MEREDNFAFGLAVVLPTLAIELNKRANVLGHGFLQWGGYGALAGMALGVGYFINNFVYNAFCADKDKIGTHRFILILTSIATTAVTTFALSDPSLTVAHIAFNITVAAIAINVFLKTTNVNQQECVEL
jgi:hypothetical protein